MERERRKRKKERGYLIDTIGQVKQNKAKQSKAKQRGFRCCAKSESESENEVGLFALRHDDDDKTYGRLER